MTGNNSSDKLQQQQQQRQRQMSNDVLASFLDEVLRQIVQHTNDDGGCDGGPVTATSVDAAKNSIDIVLDNARFHDSYTTSPSPRRRSKKMTPFMFQYKNSRSKLSKSNRWEETSKSNNFIAKQVSSLKHQQVVELPPAPPPPLLPPSMSGSILKNGATSRWDSMMTNHNNDDSSSSFSSCSTSEEGNKNSNSDGNDGSSGHTTTTTSANRNNSHHSHHHHNHIVDTQLPNVPERKEVFDRFTLANSPNYMRRSKRNLFMRSNSLQKLQQEAQSNSTTCELPYS